MASCDSNRCDGAWDDPESSGSTIDATHLDDAVSVSSSVPGEGERRLVIFDWGDTLFPTSWMQRQGFFNADDVLPSMQQASQLQTLADAVKTSLQAALQFGKVAVVTNAETGWVERSCSEAMPSLAHVLLEVDIISARSTYKRYSQDPGEWKRLAFAHEIELLHIQEGEQLNVVSVGDSLHERYAVISVCENAHSCSAKSVKFIDRPSIEDLIDQHEIFNSSFWDVAEHDGSLDVEMESSPRIKSSGRQHWLFPRWW